MITKDLIPFPGAKSFAIMETPYITNGAERDDRERFPRSWAKT